MTEVDVVADSIKSMKVRGARDIAIAAAEALKDVVKAGGKMAELESAGERLKAARPSAISLPNAVNYVLYLADGNKALPDDEFKEKTLKEIDDFLKQIKNSILKIAEIGAEIIKDGDVILTHCNSDTAISILKKAWSDGKKISVVCTEARPRHQGYITAKQCSEHGIPTTLIIDSAVHWAMKEFGVDKVIVGADTICANGDVVNKVGTANIALAAKESDVDFFVAADSLKFSAQSLMGKTVNIEERDTSEVTEIEGVTIRNPGFDVTEAQYVDAIITEEGVMPSQAAYHLLKAKYGWELSK
ncbi:MAG: ribose 1,5-bisphosphate isomerase [Candidatus Altiarchaeota archaeon]